MFVCVIKFKVFGTTAGEDLNFKQSIQNLEDLEQYQQLVSHSQNTGIMFTTTQNSQQFIGRLRVSGSIPDAYDHQKIMQRTKNSKNKLSS
jgi:hypothetical protein